jgi:bifunctional DNase/RNase
LTPPECIPIFKPKGEHVMLHRVRIQGLILDPITERPILLLKNDEDSRVLPIWIGSSEANAIALRLEHIEVPRPMTHDLLCGILDQTQTSLKEVRITDLRDNTYFADIVLARREGEVHVDSRPSDAVALAVRAGAPIFVEESVFEKTFSVDENASGEQLARWLEQLSPEEMGRYEM